MLRREGYVRVKGAAKPLAGAHDASVNSLDAESHVEAAQATALIPHWTARGR